MKLDTIDVFIPQQLYTEIVDKADSNRFNAHCWRCQPNADVCNITVEESSELETTTARFTETQTDAEHSLVVLPLRQEPLR